MKNDSIKKFLSKDEKIKQKIKILEDICKNMDPDIKKANQSLIENVAFMSVSLAELQSIINEKGYTETYTNGATQSGIKKC
jgi:hypothetical protein